MWNELSSLPWVRWGGTGGIPEPVEGTLLWPPDGDAVLEGAALKLGFVAGPADISTATCVGLDRASGLCS